MTPTPTVLVVSDPADDEARIVAGLLEARGVCVRWFDTATVPAHTHLAIRSGDETCVASSLHIDGETIDLDEIETVWIRRPRPVVAPQGDARTRQQVEAECEYALACLWATAQCRWFPGAHDHIRRANRKPWQLQLAARVGFDVPDTLVTNHPEAFLSFFRRHNGKVVSKPCGAPVSTRRPRYTERVTRNEVVRHRAVAAAPVCFQEEVIKRLELRVTVVRDAVFAVAIDSQADRRHSLDWRRAGAKNLSYRPHRLPEEVAARCRNLVERLRLAYGAIDLVLTPDGRYVFLEINPGGRWRWLEEHTGLPITAAICDALAPTRTQELGRYAS